MPSLEGKPTSQWTKSLGDYYASRRESDIRKASQTRERDAILRLQHERLISADEAFDALHKSSDLAVALSGLQTLVATRQAQQAQAQAQAQAQQDRAQRWAQYVAAHRDSYDNHGNPRNYQADEPPDWFK